MFLLLSHLGGEWRREGKRDRWGGEGMVAVRVEGILGSACHPISSSSGEQEEMKEEGIVGVGEEKKGWLQ